MGYLNSNRRDEEPEEQDWLMSHADLMTLLLGFFIILYSISHIDEGKLKQVTQSFTTAFENPSQGQGSAASIQERSEQSLNAVFDVMNIEGDYQRRLEELEKRLRSLDATKETKDIIKTQLAGETEIVEEGKEIKIVLPEHLLFQKKSRKLSKKGRQKAGKILSSLKPYIVGNVKLEITGHTDKGETKRQSEAFIVSSIRAGEVAKIALSQGIDPQSLKVSGLADTDQSISEKGLRNKALSIARRSNRRVELRVRFPK